MRARDLWLALIVLMRRLTNEPLTGLLPNALTSALCVLGFILGGALVLPLYYSRKIDANYRSPSRVGGGEWLTMATQQQER